MAEVQTGDAVAIHFTGSFEDGTVFDSSEDRDPLRFEAGGEDVITGISNAVLGMNVGDKRQVTITPEEGFGERIPDLQQVVPADRLPDDVSEGDAVRAEMDGSELTLWVTAIDDEGVTLDANHPLAGKTLIFAIELAECTPKAAG